MQLIDHELDQALLLVRGHREVDFTGYKRGVLRRRVEHRAIMRGCLRIADYLDMLRVEPAEIDALVEALRLKVTGFFRDPGTWKVVQESVLPELIERRKKRRVLRAWSAGCSTGQEAYSLIMAIAEVLGTRWADWDVLVCATNADEIALKHARGGVYPTALLTGLDPARRKRWLEPSRGGDFRIKSELRQRVRFAVRDLIAQTPLRPMDLVLCRNVLMFFEPPAQQKVLIKLRRSLDPDGVLVLGPAERIPRVLDQFTLLDDQHRIYRSALQ